MSKRSTSILLIISLAFNLAVLGGFIFRQIWRPITPQLKDFQAERAQRRIELDRSDPALRPPTESEETRELRKAFRQTKEDFMTQLANEPVNEEKLKESLEQSLSQQVELERSLGESLILRRKEMSPEEAQEHFMRRVERMRERSERIERWMENPDRERRLNRSRRNNEEDNQPNTDS